MENLPAPRILIIGVHPNHLKILADILKKMNCRIRTLMNGDPVLTAVAEKRPDLILLEEQLTERSGYEVCRLLKQDDRTRSIPVLFITAFMDAGIREKIFSAGGVDYLITPFCEKEVTPRIQMHLEFQKPRKFLPEKEVEDLRKAEKVQNKKNAALQLEERERNYREPVPNAKSEFLTNISHEIRTPLNIIMGLSHLSLRTEPDTRHAENFQKILAASRSLLEIINDILYYAEIDAGKVVISSGTFNLETVCRNLEKKYLPKAKNKKLNFRIILEDDVPKHLIGDPNKLKQAVVHLTDNAVKFTEKGEVRLTVRPKSVTSEEAVLEFSLRDTGIGMTEVQMEKLFQPFSQADGSLTRKYGGTGLGLIIAKRLILMMGGDIRAESEFGKGSRFVFTVRFGLSTVPRTVSAETTEAEAEPAAPAPNPSPAAVPAEAAPAHAAAGDESVHILLVEDSSINQLIAVKILEQACFRVTTVFNGLEALKRLETEAFDLVLMDIQMPVMDGLQASRFIRERNITARRKAGESPAPIPIIAMTAHAGKEDQERHHAAGMNDQISKPFQPDELIGTLLSWASERLQEIPEVPVKTPPVPTSFPAVSGIDTVGGLLRAGGDSAVYCEVLKKFCAEYADAGIHLRNALDREEIQDACALAHTLKGTAGNLGITDVQKGAEKLEQALREPDHPSVGPVLAALEENLNTALQAMGTICLNADPFHSKVKPAETGKLRYFLTELKPHIEKNRPRPCKAVLTEMDAYSWPGTVAEDVERLGQEIHRYRFKAALEILNMLLE